MDLEQGWDGGWRRRQRWVSVGPRESLCLHIVSTVIISAKCWLLPLLRAPVFGLGKQGYTSIMPFSKGKQHSTSGLASHSLSREPKLAPCLFWLIKFYWNTDMLTFPFSLWLLFMMSWAVVRDFNAHHTYFWLFTEKSTDHCSRTMFPVDDSWRSATFLTGCPSPETRAPSPLWLWLPQSGDQLPLFLVARRLGLHIYS